jgi:hypothetical protein
VPWRVIVRFSLNNDQKSTVRNEIQAILSSAGIVNTGTGTWEAAAADETKVASQLSELLARLASAGGQGVGLDHVWIYIDRPDA